MPKPKKDETLKDAGMPPGVEPASPEVDVAPLHNQSDVSAQVQQDAIAERITADQAARRGDRQVVIGPGGKRYSYEDVHMDMRYPLTRDSDMLADPVKSGIIKPGHHKAGYRYLWPKRLADTTANHVASGLYEIVPQDDVQAVPGIGIAKVTLPNGVEGVAWNAHILVRMSPEHWDEVMNHWERLSWRRQIQKTQSPLGERSGVEVTAEVKHKSTETVLLPS